MTDTPRIDDAIYTLQQAAEASFMAYGDDKLVETFGEYEAEYAVIRKGVGLLDLPQVGLIRVMGSDRADFLHRFVTNTVKTLAPGQANRSFLLTRAGRIAADMIILAGEKEHLIILDRCDAGEVASQLDKFLFSEDVQFKNVSDDHRLLALHGPQGAAVLNHLGAEKAHELTHGQSLNANLASRSATVLRWDATGSMGFMLVLSREDAAGAYQAIVDYFGGLLPDVEGGVRRSVTGRGIGWMAFNTARIEAGQALYHIDFGPDSLPHETNTIPQTVSFTKGCYLGQEIVARMHNLGHPKKILVGLAFKDDKLPLAGAAVLEADGQTVIGAVTSSCLSPLAGNQAIALAMMKWGKHTEGTQVLVSAEGTQVPAQVRLLKL